MGWRDSDIPALHGLCSFTFSEVDLCSEEGTRWVQVLWGLCCLAVCTIHAFVCLFVCLCVCPSVSMYGLMCTSLCLFHFVVCRIHALVCLRLCVCLCQSKATSICTLLFCLLVCLTACIHCVSVLVSIVSVCLYPLSLYLYPLCHCSCVHCSVYLYPPCQRVPLLINNKEMS